MRRRRHAPAELGLLAVRLLATAVLFSLVACGGSQQPKAQPAEPSKPALHQGPITDFVPAAGLRWMAVVRPKELLQDQTLRQGLEKLFPNQRLDGFAQNSGLDLRGLGVGCVAGFDLGTLYLAETTSAVDSVQRAFLARLASDPVTKHPGPGVVHITGLIGLTPESFVGLSGRLVGVSVKDPTLTKIVGAFALERLKKSPSALFGAALSSLPKTLAIDPLQFYAPGPFSDEWAEGAHGLLGASLAAGMAARINTPGFVDALIVLAGDYGNDSQATVQRALETFQDLAQSGLGRILTLHEAGVMPEIQATPTEVTLRVRLPLQQLLDGLYAAVAANVWELLDYKPR